MTDGVGEALNSGFSVLLLNFRNLMSHLVYGEFPLVNFRQNSLVFPSPGRMHSRELASNLDHVTLREEITPGLVLGY